MKFLVVLALFAAAAAEPEAEADPWVYYTHGAAAYHPYTYGYGYPYYQYVAPTVKVADEKVEEVVEAKAAEVKKPVVYTHPYYYGGYAGLHYPYAYNYAPVAHTVVKPYTYYANSGGAVHVVKKREAEADADPNAWYGYGYGYRPYWGGYSAYRSAYYHPYTYGAYGHYGYGGYYYGK